MSRRCSCDYRRQRHPSPCPQGWVLRVPTRRSCSPAVHRSPASRGIDGASRLRKRIRADEYALFQLYNAVAPEAVRRRRGRHVERVESRPGPQLARRSRVSTGLGARRSHHRLAPLSGRRQHRPLRSDDSPIGARRQEALLDAGLVAAGRKRLLLTLVPEYADGLGRALSRRGFERGPEYSSL